LTFYFSMRIVMIARVNEVLREDFGSSLPLSGTNRGNFVDNCNAVCMPGKVCSHARHCGENLTMQYKSFKNIQFLVRRKIYD
jgi:anaerobic selenocysteine-containing dehydrogenase